MDGWEATRAQPARAAGTGTQYFPTIWKTARDRTRYDVNETPRKQLAHAVREAGPGAPAGKVIAELPFGFWRYLSSSAHEVSLWRPYLHRAFAGGTGRNAVDRPLSRLHKLRNRVAHHEPLLNQDLPARHDDVLAIAALISSELQDYIQDHSDFDSLTTRRPIPAR